MKYTTKQKLRIMKLLSYCDGHTSNLGIGLLGHIRFDYESNTSYSCGFEYTLVYENNEAPESGDNYDLNIELSAKFDFKNSVFTAILESYVDMDSNSKDYDELSSYFNCKKTKTSDCISEIFSNLYIGDEDFISYQNASASHISECFNKFIEYVNTINEENNEENNEDESSWLAEFIDKVNNSSHLMIVSYDIDIQNFINSPNQFDRIDVKTIDRTNIITICANTALTYKFEVYIVNGLDDDDDDDEYAEYGLIRAEITSKEELNAFIYDLIDDLNDHDGFEKYADYLEELV